VVQFNFFFIFPVLIFTFVKTKISMFLYKFFSFFRGNKKRLSQADNNTYLALKEGLLNPEKWHGFYIGATFIIDEFQLIINPDGRYNNYNNWISGNESKQAPPDICKLVKEKYLQYRPDGEFFKRKKIPVKTL